MQFCVVPRKSLLALTLALAFGAAHASVSLETKGTPAANPVTMTTFGVDVPAKQGLKTVLPEGWELLLHQSAVLPDRISWADGQTWVSAMDQFAAEGRLSALVDWDKRKVFLRSQAVAAAEAATRAPALAPAPVQVAQAVVAPVAAAPTPVALPTLAVAAVEKTAVDDPAPVLASPVAPDRAAEIADISATLKAGALPVPTLTVGAPAAASIAPDVASAPVLAVPDQASSGLRKPGRHSRAPVVTADAVVPSDAAAFFGATSPNAPPVLVTESSAQVQATSSVPTVSAAGVPAPAAPRAIVRPSVPAQTFAVVDPAKSDTAAYNRLAVSDVLERVARVHGFVVSYDTDIAARFDGPVTVLAADMGEDLKLMSRALGPASAVAFELYRPSQLVRVVASEPGKRGLVVYDRPYTGEVRPHRLVRALTDATNTVVDSNAGANRYQDVAPVPLAAVPSAYPSRPVAAPAPSMAPEQPIAVVTVPAVKQLHFRVDIDESLQEKLEQFLAAQGYALDWKVNEVLNAEQVLESSGKSIKEVLAFLPKLGLSADIDSLSNTKRVVVRPGDEAIDKQ